MDSNSPKKPLRKRARKPDGSFKGDNPATPNVNEAWEPTELAEVVSPKEVKYSVRQKVDGTSNPTAGKYAKKGKIHPTFGKVTTTHF
jgi:hypothetical protein